MSEVDKKILKNNVAQFDNDVSRLGGYVYTGERLSSSIANANISRAIHRACAANANRRVLDIGCGDGAYTFEFLGQGASQILGLDPSLKAIERAKVRASGLDAEARKKIAFAVGNVYQLDRLENFSLNEFDCIVLRGVLHHLPDAGKALEALTEFKGKLIILEPNGWNPVLKILEKVSSYHRTHEEQSFLPATLTQWLENAGFTVQSVRFINCVPMFCPDWLARLASAATPVVERLPLARVLGCGQQIIVAKKG